jgi:hypothetical protein
MNRCSVTYDGWSGTKMTDGRNKNDGWSGDHASHMTDGLTLPTVIYDG